MAAIGHDAMRIAVSVGELVDPPVTTALLRQIVSSNLAAGQPSDRQLPGSALGSRNVHVWTRGDCRRNPHAGRARESPGVAVRRRRARRGGVAALPRDAVTFVTFQGRAIAARASTAAKGHGALRTAYPGAWSDNGAFLVIPDWEGRTWDARWLVP